MLPVINTEIKFQIDYHLLIATTKLELAYFFSNNNLVLILINPFFFTSIMIKNQPLSPHFILIILTSKMEMIGYAYLIILFLFLKELLLFY